MRAEIIKLKMPFKSGIIFREKEVPFLFKIMTLEMTCDYLGQDLGDLFTKENSEADVYQALVWNGYLSACKELFKKPKYTEAKAFFWAEYMSAETRKELMAEVTKLMGYLKEGSKKGSEDIKKK